MNLVLLHGAPASGKYTVGQALAALTGYPLYHNHLVVDEVLQRHAFGTPEFIAARDRAWRDYFTQAAQQQTPGVTFTFNPENTVPQSFIDWLFGDLPRQGVGIISVELLATEAVIEARLAEASRRQFRKLTDLMLYRQQRDSGSFRTPLIPRTDLRIDTEKEKPTAAARRITEYFHLC